MRGPADRSVFRRPWSRVVGEQPVVDQGIEEELLAHILEEVLTPALETCRAGDLDVGQVPAASIERVEVIRCPGSAMYGTFSRGPGHQRRDSPRCRTPWPDPGCHGRCDGDRAGWRHDDRSRSVNDAGREASLEAVASESPPYGGFGEDGGNAGIIRSPLHASVLPDSTFEGLALEHPGLRHVHVTQPLNKAVYTVRRQEVHSLRAPVAPLFSPKTRWPLVKRPRNLRSEERGRLRRMLKIKDACARCSRSTELSSPLRSPRSRVRPDIDGHATYWSVENCQQERQSVAGQRAVPHPAIEVLSGERSRHAHTRSTDR